MRVLARAWCVGTVVWLFFLLERIDAAILHCRVVEDVYEAMVNVRPGDEIVLAPGLYVATRSAIPDTEAHFASFVNGTADKPIVLRSQDKENPAVLRGEDEYLAIAIRIFGNHWTVQDLVITKVQKGIVFDHAWYGRIVGCTLYGIGYEAIHWRDGSHYGLVDGCRVYDTGTREPGFGEAVYVGTSTGQWDDFDPNVTHITIRNCVLGPGVSGEALDIKEETSDILVEHNVLDGRGISNLNFADSLVDLKGSRATVRYNTFYRSGETKLEAAVAILQRGTPRSGTQNVLHDNVFYMDEDGTGVYLLQARNGTNDTYAWNNVRHPADGRLYKRKGVLTDKCCPPWYNLPFCLPPSVMEIVSTTSSTATLQWMAHDDDNNTATHVSYTVVYSVIGSENATTTTTSTTTTTTTTTLKLENLHDSSEYHVRVKTVCNETDQSAFSAYYRFRTQPPPPLVFTVQGLDASFAKAPFTSSLQGVCLVSVVLFVSGRARRRRQQQQQQR